MRHECITSENQVLIVGFGLAGSLMAWKFWVQGIAFEIVDHNFEYRASSAAAGIMNPITGRVYSLTWNYEDLWNEAVPFYTNLEEKLACKFFRQMPLYRGIDTIKSLNDWNVRAEMIPHKLMQELVEPSEINPNLDFLSKYFGKVDCAYQLNIPSFVRASRLFFRENGCSIRDHYFNYEELDQGKDLSYRNRKYSAVIFCEGSFLSENPFFPKVRIRPSKGEVFIIKSESLNSGLIFKDRFFVCPLFETNTYWIGSNYDNHFEDPGPSGDMYSELKSFVDSLTIPDYELIGHISGIRPTVADRKPLVGFHPQDSRLICFNGLGTKGSSLGPWSAEQLIRKLCYDIPIPKEVDVARYF